VPVSASSICVISPRLRDHSCTILHQTMARMLYMHAPDNIVCVCAVTSMTTRIPKSTSHSNHSSPCVDNYSVTRRCRCTCRCTCVGVYVYVCLFVYVITCAWNHMPSACFKTLRRKPLTTSCSANNGTAAVVLDDVMCTTSVSFRYYVCAFRMNTRAQLTDRNEKAARPMLIFAFRKPHSAYIPEFERETA
jgi:hypothetical protein